MIPLVYSPHYNITACGLERLHPFDSVKYRRIHDWLIAQGLRRAADFLTPESCTPADLMRVHTEAYLHRLKTRAEAARILEVPIVRLLPACVTNWRVLRPMRCATGGTILACRLARTHGLAINLAGGYHHASGEHGHGFCAYADVPIALAVLHDETPFRSVLIVDTDAHQGDGSARATRTWPWVHVLDFFEAGIFPWPKADEEFPVPLRSGLDGVGYLDLLQTHLPRVLDQCAPDLVVYNAGSDVLADDPLTSLQLSVLDMIDRDLFVASTVRDRGIPFAMVLSGGYGPNSWKAHALAIESILVRFDTK